MVRDGAVVTWTYAAFIYYNNVINCVAVLVVLPTDGRIVDATWMAAARRGETVVLGVLYY